MSGDQETEAAQVETAKAFAKAIRANGGRVLLAAFCVQANNLTAMTADRRHAHTCSGLYKRPPLGSSLPHCRDRVYPRSNPDWSAGASGEASTLDAAMEELSMDAYDNDDEEESAAGLFGGRHPGMALYRSNEEDPYISLKADVEDESEQADFDYKPTDLLLLAARNEDDVSHLEVGPGFCVQKGSVVVPCAGWTWQILQPCALHASSGCISCTKYTHG